MVERKYAAYFTNSDVRREPFVYYSSHRAGSKQNKEDMYHQLVQQYGLRHANYVINWYDKSYICDFE